MARKSESQIDTEMAKRIRWENSRNEQRDFIVLMNEKMKHDLTETPREIKENKDLYKQPPRTRRDKKK